MKSASMIHPASLIGWTRRFGERRIASILILLGPSRAIVRHTNLHVHLRCLGGRWYGAVPAIYCIWHPSVDGVLSILVLIYKCVMFIVKSAPIKESNCRARSELFFPFLSVFASLDFVEYRTKAMRSGKFGLYDDILAYEFSQVRILLQATLRVASWPVPIGSSTGFAAAMGTCALQC